MSQTKAQLLGPVLGTVEYAGDVNFDSGTLFVDSANNRIGIGTDNPSYLLDLAGVSNPQIRLNGSTNTGQRGLLFAYNQVTFGQLGLNVQTGEFRIRSGESGQTGYFIGLETNGQKRLSVNSDGSTTMHVNSATHQTFRFTTQGSNEAKLIMRDADSNEDIILNTGGSTYFNNDYNFGLGMSNPSAKLHIQKNSGDTDFTDETTPSSTSGVQIANLATGAGTFTALTLSVSSGVATQNASVIAKATSSGTAPEMHFTQRSNNNTVSRLVINSSGNVGIATDNPGAKLHIQGTNSEIWLRDSDSKTLALQTTSNIQYIKAIDVGTGALPLQFYASKYNFTTGNVGIGTDNPQEKLHLFASTSATQRISNTSSSAYNTIQFVNDSNYYGYLWQNGSAISAYGGPNALHLANYNGPLVFSSSSSGSYSQRAIIDTSGNIGIGTDNPGSLLDLKTDTGVDPTTPTTLRISTSTVNTTGWSTSNPWGVIDFYSDNFASGLPDSGPKVHARIAAVASSSKGRSSNLNFELVDGISSSTRSTILSLSTGGVGVNRTFTLTPTNDISAIYKNSSDSECLYLRTSSTQVTWESRGGKNFVWSQGYATSLILNSSGNVGIGTDNPNHNLHVASDSSSVTSVAIINSESGQSRLWLQAGGTTNRASRIDFVNSQASTSVPRWTLLNDYDQNGGNSFDFVNSSNSRVLSINQSGNVGIGTNNPTAKLQVQGSSYITSKLSVGISQFTDNAGLTVSTSGAKFFNDSLWMQPAGNVLFSARGGSGDDNWIGIGGFYNVSGGSSNILLQANFGGTGTGSGHAIRSIATGTGTQDFKIQRVYAAASTSGRPTYTDVLTINNDNGVSIVNQGGTTTTFAANGITQMSQERTFEFAISEASNYPTCNVGASQFAIGSFSGNSGHYYMVIEAWCHHRGYTNGGYFEYKKWIVIVGDKISSNLVEGAGNDNHLGLWDGSSSSNSGFNNFNTSGATMYLMVNPSCGAGRSGRCRVRYYQSMPFTPDGSRISANTTVRSNQQSPFRGNGGSKPYIGNYSTTSSSANVHVSSGELYEVTSSSRYKTNIEDLESSYADNVIDNLRPVWYRSNQENTDDPANHSYFGLIAEEVAEVEPRLVNYTHFDEDYEDVLTGTYTDENGEEQVTVERQLKADAELRPQSVQYDRLSVMLLDVIQRQKAELAALTARVAALEGGN